MHGDRVTAAIHTVNNKDVAEPEALITPFLDRFVGRVQRKENDDRLWIIPDHPLLKDSIPCRPAKGVDHEFRQGDWAVAEMRRHPLKGDRSFHAEITGFITDADDHYAPWWVTLTRHQHALKEPEPVEVTMADDNLPRTDLTHLDFVTIDSASTEDMDDALYITTGDNNQLQLTIAIADPTSYIPAGSELDAIAHKRAFTNYLRALISRCCRVTCLMTCARCIRMCAARHWCVRSPLMKMALWRMMPYSSPPGLNPKPSWLTTMSLTCWKVWLTA